MYYITIRNKETGDLATLKVFDYIEVGTIIGWGTNDGETIAQWEVMFCYKANSI